MSHEGRRLVVPTSDLAGPTALDARSTNTPFEMSGNGGYAKLEDEPALVISGKGLTTAEAAAAQAKWGKNEIPEEKEPVTAGGCSASNAARRLHFPCRRDATGPGPSGLLAVRHSKLDAGVFLVPSLFTALEDVRDAVRGHHAGDD